MFYTEDVYKRLSFVFQNFATFDFTKKDRQPKRPRDVYTPIPYL